MSLELRAGARLSNAAPFPSSQSEQRTICNVNLSVGVELIYAGLHDEVPDEDRSFLRMHEAR